MNEFQPIEIVDLETIIELKETSPRSNIIGSPMVKAQWIINNLICRILEISNIKNLDEDGYKDRKKMIEDGLNCNLLKLGDSQWQKGKVRIKISLEFIPDEMSSSDYKSPLDEIRQAIINK